MAQPSIRVYLASSHVTTEEPTMAIKLRGDGRRRALQVKRVLDHIAARDVKTAAQNPARSVVIFPLTDSALQAALTAVRARITTLLT